MAELTATQRADLQGDLDIGSAEAIFTNDELDRLYTRADEDYDATVVLAIRQLLMHAAKFADYTAGQTSEKKAQVFEHLGRLLAYYEKKADSATQVQIVGATSVPPRTRERPGEKGSSTRSKYRWVI